MRRDEKRSKKRKKREEKTPPAALKKVAHAAPKAGKKRPQTPNGQLIQDLIDKAQVKGFYKDFVVIVGRRLVDWTGSWDMYGSDGQSIGIEGVKLLHKSKLKGLIEGPLLDKLWHPTLGSRGQTLPR
jgi:hypothetical protein